jgi:DNA-binding NarL/FixJ family response regulator
MFGNNRGVAMNYVEDPERMLRALPQLNAAERLILRTIIREAESRQARISAEPPPPRARNFGILRSPPYGLTKREIEVAELLFAGNSYKEAGVALKISPRTIEVHRARIIAKLEVKNTAGMVRKIMELT